MAVINCPSCNKKISDKAKTCTHCNIAIGSLNEDQRHTIEVETRIKQQQSLMNHSFIAILLFCAGFLFLYLKDAQPGTWQYLVSMASSGVGFCLYIVTRIRILLLKRKKK